MEINSNLFSRFVFFGGYGSYIPPKLPGEMGKSSNFSRRNIFKWSGFRVPLHDFYEMPKCQDAKGNLGIANRRGSDDLHDRNLH